MNGKMVTRSYNRVPTTERRQAILDFVRAYRREHGMSPTMKEIGDSIRATPSLVRYHLVQLYNEGYVTWDENQHRTLKPTTRRKYSL